MKMGVGLLTPWQSVQIRSGSLLVKACNVGNQPGIAANTIRVDGPGPQSYIMRAIGELVRTHHPLKVVTAGSIPAWPIGHHVQHAVSCCTDGPLRSHSVAAITVPSQGTNSGASPDGSIDGPPRGVDGRLISVLWPVRVRSDQ
jgi:hypothetical protein